MSKIQTFLPYPSFAASAKVLDWRRLGNQRHETLTICRALIGGGGWSRHPVTLMWQNHLGALLAYQRAVCGEWVWRGYKDTCLYKMAMDLHEAECLPEPMDNPVLPPWFGDVEFHLAHQSNLIRKDRWFYGPKFPGVSDDLPYIYPKPVPL